VVAGLTVAAVGKPDGAAICFFFSVQRHQSRCLLSSSSVCSSFRFLPSSLCFFLYAFYSLFISFSFFLLPFSLSVLLCFFSFPFVFLLFSSSRWYCLSLSKPLFPVNISSFSVIFLSGRSLFSLLYSFPRFFSFLLLLCVFVLFFLHPFLSKISPLVLLSSPVFIDRRREQLPCLSAQS